MHLSKRYLSVALAALPSGTAGVGSAQPPPAAPLIKGDRILFAGDVVMHQTLVAIAYTEAQ